MQRGLGPKHRSVGRSDVVSHPECKVDISAVHVDRALGIGEKEDQIMHSRRDRCILDWQVAQSVRYCSGLAMSGRPESGRLGTCRRFHRSEQAESVGRLGDSILVLTLTCQQRWDFGREHLLDIPKVFVPRHSKVCNVQTSLLEPAQSHQSW